MSDRYPFLISIPHGGVSVPPEIRGRIALSRKEIVFNSDPYTRRIYGFGDRVEAVIDTEVSRIFVDTNRPPYEYPPLNQDGVLKVVTQDGTPVYKKGQFPTKDLIAALLRGYYYPFHERLTEALGTHPIGIAFDCHSMLPNAPPVQMNAGTSRPLICLSNRGDRRGMPRRRDSLVTCPPEWLQALARSFQREFSGEGRIAMNDPFKGGFISVAHYRQSRIPWIQIEINRGMYENERYIDPATHLVDEKRIADLEGRIFAVLTRFWDEIED
jgi:N-formylglutamate deformylase